jgi:hypothetical protein
MPSSETSVPIWEPHNISTILRTPLTLKIPSGYAISPLTNNYILMPLISQSSSPGYGNRPQGAGRSFDIPKSGDIPIVAFDEVSTKMVKTDSMINTVVPERKFLERWGPPSRVSKKGKAGPLEAGRGKYSPPANPERVTSEGLERRNNGVYLSEIKYTINSIDCKNIVNKNQETPGI